jgi:hypothetical protein
VEFVSPDQYQGLTCQEIGAEGERVARQVAQITGAEPNGTDLSIAGQPIVVLWPSPLVELSEENSKELARLKGQFEALDEASRRKRCSYSFKQQQA